MMAAVPPLIETRCDGTFHSLAKRLTPMNRHAARRNRLRKKLRLAKSEGLLVTNLKNVSYLTNFSGSSAWLLATKTNEILVSDSRYQTQIENECPGIDCEIRDPASTLLDTLARVCRSTGIETLRYESESISKSQFDQLASKLESVDLVASSGCVEGLRSIKDKSEIKAIRNSIKVNQKTFEVIRSQLRPDQTELQVAHNLEHQMRQFGATGCSFDPIVAVGARSALPHASPTEHQIGENPILLIDWGAEVDHYASDLTRVLVTAKIPPKLRKVYQIVLDAQQRAIEKIRPGVSFQQVDLVARQVIEAAGYGKFFGHGLGHSFGLEIHESPYLSPISKGKLAVGMVVTVEPGIYLPGWGGVRIEDDVLVTQNGCEVLSDLPKELEECVVDGW